MQSKWYVLYEQECDGGCHPYWEDQKEDFYDIESAIKFADEINQKRAEDKGYWRKDAIICQEVNYETIRNNT